jgi:putative transposase
MPPLATLRKRGVKLCYLLGEIFADDNLAVIRSYLQQQRALGKDDFRAMIEAKSRRFDSVWPAHRPARKNSSARK